MVSAEAFRHLPLGKNFRVVHFVKSSLCQVWLKLAQWFWKRRWKCEKFTDEQTDRGRTTGD